MADDYPDPDEEFDLQYEDDMEAMQEFDDENFVPPDPKFHTKSKKSLDFSSPKGAEALSTSENSNLATPLSDGYNPDEQSQLTPGQKNNTSLIVDDNAVDGSAVDEVTVIEDENVAAKRKIDELFGDVDDIDFNEEIITKRSRLNYERPKEVELTEEQRMDITIQKILAARRQYKLDDVTSVPEERVHNKRVSSVAKLASEMSRKVPSFPFISVSDALGDKLYLLFRSEEVFDYEVEEISKQCNTGGLLSVPYFKIKEEAEAILQQQSASKEAQANKLADSDVMEVPSEAIEGELWVEKYRPKRYLDLLSDEGTNKSLLRWLKLWDKVVFNKENKIKIKPKFEEKKFGGGKFKKKFDNELNEQLDELGRPHHKVALLCGPPGLGKTTLGHILARHAGYNVVEMNASDDRSPDLFRTQLEAATQMKAVMGKDPRPNCLVLDEIDGAPQASIEVVVKFATGKDGAKGGGGRGKKKKGDLRGVLKRPIICICNDAYVPALRPLRQIAYVLHFPPTCSYRLAQRLCEISKLQHLKTDLGTMMALGEKTNNDIRACLSLLHCLKSQSGNTIRLSQINNAQLGAKDVQKSLFAVWQEIFQIKNANRLSSVLRTVQGCGDYERLAQGVYENYLTLKLKGSSLKSISEGLEWFVHHDVLTTHIHSTQNYTMYSYLPYSFAKWHFLFAGRLWPKLTFPSMGYELVTKTARTKSLLDVMLRGMSPQTRPYERRETLLLDVLSLLLEIIIPSIRPVSVQLYNEKEKKELCKVVNTMLDYNLCYTQERAQDGSYVFNLDPNIEEVAKFPGWKPVRTLNYAGRQQVQRELDIERIRRIEANLNQGKPPPKMNNNAERSSGKTSVQTEKGALLKKDDMDKPLPNHLQRLTPKTLKKPASEVVSKDFFGRIIETPVDDLISNAVQEGKDVWLRFKEGYNNAVRLRVRMSDLY